MAVQGSKHPEVPAKKVGSILVPNTLVPNGPGIIAVRMKDDSLSPKFSRGAIVFLDKARTRAKSGEIVAVNVDGRPTLRRLVRVGRAAVLEPINRDDHGKVTIKDGRHLRVSGVHVGHWTDAKERASRSGARAVRSATA